MARNDVLIIGAGPSGLFAAAELARHGVDVRLIEQEARPHHEARATAIQPGTLEILDSVGLLPPFLESSEHVRRVRVYGPDMSELSALDFEGIDCRCEFQCSLPQYETQRILETHLSSLGGVVERGSRQRRWTRMRDGVLVELVHADGVETVHPDVVIGADGAHSVTRQSMSEPLEGTTYQGHFLVADIAMQAPVPRDQGSFFCGPDGMMLLAPLPGGAGSLSRTWKRGYRRYPTKTSPHAPRYASVGGVDPPTSPGSRRFGCTGGSSPAWRPASAS